MRDLAFLIYATPIALSGRMAAQYRQWCAMAFGLSYQ